MAIRVLIAESRTLVREGLVKLLESDPGIEVVGTTDTGFEVIRLVSEKQPDVVMVNYDLTALDGVATTNLIVKKHPSVKVIMLPVYGELEEDVVVDAVRCGARGYIPEGADAKTMITQIRRIVSNGMALNEEITGRLLDRLVNNVERSHIVQDDVQFTGREIDVLELICHGISNKQMASILFVSENTVRAHVSSLIQKVRVENRTQLAIYGMRKGYGQRPLPSAGSDGPETKSRRPAGLPDDAGHFNGHSNGAGAGWIKRSHSAFGRNSHRLAPATVPAGSR